MTLPVFCTSIYGENLYHFGIEAVMRQLSNKGQSAGPRLPHKVFPYSLYSLKVVLQQSGQNRNGRCYGYKYRSELFYK